VEAEYIIDGCTVCKKHLDEIYELYDIIFGKGNSSEGTEK